MSIRQIKTNLGANVQERNFEGRPHLVRPVVILVEGVHCGSGGCVLYTARELAASAPLWNGMPVPIYHPERNGEAVSANSPEVLANQCIGRIFNMKFEDGKLVGEIWVDVNKAEGIAPGVLDSFRNGDVIEVSTGLYSDCDNIAGVWNREQHIGTVRSLRPDHLALLPGFKGACSVADGCGVQANQEAPTFVINQETTINATQVPADLKVEVKGVRARTGETVKMKQNAREFLAANEAASERYRNLLDAVDA